MPERSTLSIGLLLNPQAPASGPSPAQLWADNMRVAQVAEEVGFTSVHVPAHHLRDDGHLPQPLIACAALAAATSSIGIGTTVVIPPLRHPVHLVEEANMVDVLSNGRLILGMGLGNHRPEFDAFGLDRREQAGRMDEILEILLRCWTGESVTFHGRFFSLDDVRIMPRAVQQPHPPLWIGSLSVAGCRRAGRFGAALLLDPLQAIIQLEPLVEAYRGACAEHGHAARLVLMRWACVSDEEAVLEAWWMRLRGVMWTYLTDIPRFAIHGSSAVSGTPQSESELRLRVVAGDRLLVGSGEEVAARMQEWAGRLGADYVIVKLQGAGGPWFEPAHDVTRRFGEQVIQRINAITAPSGGAPNLSH